MAAAHAVEAQRIHQVGLSDELIARATGAARSTVREWLRGRSAPTGTRAERLGELAEISDRLASVMQVGYIPVWLTKPVQLLNDDKPIDVIAAGNYRDVMRVVAGLAEPGAS